MNPDISPLYAGISGVQLEAESFELGQGVTLSKTFAHVMAQGRKDSPTALLRGIVDNLRTRRNQFKIIYYCAFDQKQRTYAYLLNLQRVAFPILDISGAPKTVKTNNDSLGPRLKKEGRRVPDRTRRPHARPAVSRQPGANRADADSAREPTTRPVS